MPGKSKVIKAKSGSRSVRGASSKRVAGARSAQRVEAVARSASAPRATAGAELIVRQGFVIDATGKGPVATPEVVILGNADGFRFLAEMFARLAEQARSRSAAPQPPSQLPKLEHPIHARFSDDLDFRFAAFNAANRKGVLKSFGIDLKSRQEGSLFDRYQAIVSQFGRLSNIMRREGLVAPRAEGAPAAQ